MSRTAFAPGFPTTARSQSSTMPARSASGFPTVKGPNQMCSASRMAAALSPEKYGESPRTSPQPTQPSSAVSLTYIASSAVTVPV
jgi:hypothetical protein